MLLAGTLVALGVFARLIPLGFKYDTIYRWVPEL